MSLIQGWNAASLPPAPSAALVPKGTTATGSSAATSVRRISRVTLGLAGRVRPVPTMSVRGAQKDLNGTVRVTKRSLDIKYYN